jgi:DNA repair exonuclease SbcCD nuclease subunit
MKLAIISDFHLGYERFREDAHRQAEEALGAAAEVADVLLLPGDLFDVKTPRPEVLAEAINLFRGLSKKDWKARVEKVSSESCAYTDIPIIAIPGTHERRAQGAEDAVGLLALAGMLVDVSDGFAVVRKGDERVAIYGMGGVSEEQFAGAIKRLNPTPVEGCFNVFMFHQSTKELLPFDTGSACFDDLPRGFDLYVDGHIHNRVERKVHGKPLLIPGSTVLTQLKDSEQEEKGFYVYDTKADSYEFRKINSRRFAVIRIDASGKSPDELLRDIRQAIDSAIGEAGGKPILRVELVGRLKEGFKNIDIDVRGMAKTYADRAIVDISRSGMEGGMGVGADADALRSGSLENMSVRDYGLGMFVDKLKESKYDLPVGPSEMFEILSSESNKEKAMKKALDALFSK